MEKGQILRLSPRCTDLFLSRISAFILLPYEHSEAEGGWRDGAVPQCAAHVSPLGKASQMPQEGSREGAVLCPPLQQPQGSFPPALALGDAQGHEHHALRVFRARSSLCV